MEGIALRKVSLPTDSVRGGLLTQASVLKVTANCTTTSPVARGAGVMERLLGKPPPPPPPAYPPSNPTHVAASAFATSWPRIANSTPATPR